MPLSRFKLFGHTMDTLQAELYNRIDNFNLDMAGTQLTFSQRLARENQWTKRYALRVIEEYKKFTFLAMVAGHTVTPSKQVGAVWHLHLTYSQSYWQDFCPNILGRPLHHEPTQGGEIESQKIREWYGKTLASYRTWFDEKPPSDIWPDVDGKFRSRLTIIDNFLVLLAGFVGITNVMLIEFQNETVTALILGGLVLFNISLLWKSKLERDIDFDFDGGDGDSGCGGGCGGGD